MAFDIQFWKQCCSVKHDWMNFNYVKYIIRKHINHILHEINMIIVTHPTTIVHCFRVLGTHCKGVSKQLCVYHLYRNVFLAQTRIRSLLGCIFLFRNSFQYPQSNRDSKRLSRVVAFIIDFSVSPLFPRFRKAFLTPYSKQLCGYHLQESPWKSFGNLNSTPEKWW